MKYDSIADNLTLNLLIQLLQKAAFFDFAIGKSTSIEIGCGVGKRVRIESHFIKFYHCSSNRLEVTEKH